MAGKVRISFAQAAIEDLEGVLAYYAEKGVAEVGRRLVAEAVDAVEALAAHPDMGRVVPEFSLTDLRELIPPFRIVYRREAVLNVNYFVRSATTTLAGRHAGDLGAVRRARDWPLR